ncbi:M1 family metallopeptidase [Oxyplasma meridianum]|uniref:Aminopeptidase n=1 Tax=Oxyplasma meridianum TaxID=3073602 RepID=A0AAX4NJ66_9ARCH
MDPYVYEIYLKIDSQKLEYEGKTDIVLPEAEEFLNLDSVDITIKSVSINGHNVEFEVKNQLITVHNKDHGKNVHIEYSAKIPESLKGIYYARSGKETVITTQFESTGARHAFPCFDNPSAKGIFQITLNIEKDLDAISNMKPKEVHIEGDRKDVVFYATPRMSTYLIYMGVGKFEEKKRQYRDMEIILAAPKGKLTKSDLPLEWASQALSYYDMYFNFEYFLPKLHLISVPEFAAGAMENWGAITFREIYLDIGESTSKNTLKSTMEVIFHEIVHQWFGDLVTMKWWNDLWLNESFATFMSYKAVEDIKPEWHPINDLVKMRTSQALISDSLDHSHPIDADVKDPNEVAQIFDEISYGKGASILRMIEAYVGQENFREGLRLYLSDHALGNAEGKHLWESIEKSSGMKISYIMEAWIKRMGYPYVTVEVEGSKIRMEQQRFLMSGRSTDEIWPIPMTLLHQTGKIQSIVMEERTMSLEANDFSKLNSGSTGFFRTLYKGEALDRVLSRWNTFKELDKWGIISDYYAFLRSGKATKQEYFRVMDKAMEDMEHMVVEEIASQLYHIWSVTLSQEVRKRGVDYIKSKMEKIGPKREGEDDDVSILRGVLAGMLVRMDQEYAESRSVEFKDFRNIDPDMKNSSALAFSVAGGSYHDLMKAYFETESDEDRGKLINAAGWMKSDGDRERFLDDISKGVIKRQDMQRFFTACTDSPYSRKFMLGNLEKSMDMLVKAFSGSRTPSRVLEHCISILGLDHVREINQIVEKIRKPELQTGIDKGEELLEINNAIRKAFKE